MTDHDQAIDDVARLDETSEKSGGMGRTLAYGALAASTAILVNGLSTAQAQTALTDIEILNLFLQFEYLQAQYYSYATSGGSIPAADIAGVGAAGPATGGRAITFTDPLLGQFAREVAAADLAHVRYMREQLIIAGGLAVAQPPIAVGGGLSAAMQAAGVANGFDAFANDDSFLLSAFFLQDFAVAAYKGVSALITNKTYLEGLMGIMATKAYHAAFVRQALLLKGGALVTAANAISDARDALDGPADLDQGLAPRGAASNIAPADSSGLALGRTPQQSLNIVFLNRNAISAGGFFPNGVNGTVQASAAN